MTVKLKSTSKILDAVYEMASDLRDAGLIDKQRMREYDALCLESMPGYERENPRITQAT